MLALIFVCTVSGEIEFEYAIATEKVHAFSLSHLVCGHLFVSVAHSRWELPTTIAANIEH